MHIRDPLIALALALIITAPAAAQAPAPPATPVTAPPVSLLLPNYNSVPVGEVAALEGGAFVARANDASAGLLQSRRAWRTPSRARSAAPPGRIDFELGDSRGR